MKRAFRLLAGLPLILAMADLQAAGSWVAAAPPVRVGLADRETLSEPLGPVGSGADNGVIRTVKWRYRQPVGSELSVKLCHPQGCVPLPAMRGSSRAFEGLAADAAMQLHLSLARGQDPVSVKGIQVIVNYR